MNTSQPYKTLLPVCTHLSGTLHVSLGDVFIHLSIMAIAWLLPGQLGVISPQRISGLQDRTEAEAVGRDTRKEDCGFHTYSVCSPSPSIRLKVDRWMERQRLALILSQRVGKRGTSGRDKRCGVRKWDGFALDWNLLHLSAYMLLRGYIAAVPPAVCRPVVVTLNTQPQPHVLGEKMIKSHLR